MAYDESLADRLRDALPPHVTEKKMFGGLCFLDRGNMCCGIVNDSLMLRLSKEIVVEQLKKEYTRPMDFTGRSMPSMMYVDPDGIADDSQVREWVEIALGFSRTLPSK